MNVQIEQLENRIARLTVEIDPARLEKAKKVAVRNLSKRVNIPGFRRGKAPYGMLVRMIGEDAIIEDAIDSLVQDIYRESLEESGLEPYGPGQFEKYDLAPSPTLTYTLPLQPIIALNDYRDVRMDYEEPEVDDEMVNQQIEALREQEALVEESHQPAAIGDRLQINIHSYFIDDDATTDDAEITDDETTDEAEATDTTTDDAEAIADIESDTEAVDSDSTEDDDDVDDLDDDDEDHHIDPDQEVYIHEHDLTINLNEGDDEPIAPGFTQLMVGATVDETREFTITLPETEEINEELAGRTVQFSVTVNAIENVTLPVLNDDFAARFTDQFKTPVDTVENDVDSEADEEEAEDEIEPLTLLELRMELRSRLEKQVKEEALNNYSNQVLDQMVEGADIEFPEAMLNDQIDTMIEDLGNRLKQQGLELDMYYMVTGMTEQQLREQYEDMAEQTIRRSLVLMEVMQAEKVRVTGEEMEAEIDKIVAQFGAQAYQIRQTLDSPMLRENVVNRLAQDKTFARIAEIGRDIAPSIEEIEKALEEAEADTQGDDVDSDTDTVSDMETPTATDDDAVEMSADSGETDSVGDADDAAADADGQEDASEDTEDTEDTTS